MAGTRKNITLRTPQVVVTSPQGHHTLVPSQSKVQKKNLMTEERKSRVNIPHHLPKTQKRVQDFLEEKDFGSLKVSQGDTEWTDPAGHRQTRRTGSEYFENSAVMDALFKRITAIEGNIKDLCVSVSDLLDRFGEEEKCNKETLAEIGALKTMKADKEEVMDAMAFKADQNHFDTKISHGQFSEICEGILRDIQEVILVVSQKDKVIPQSIAEAKLQLKNRLKDLVDARLLPLEEGLEAAATMEKEMGATGTEMEPGRLDSQSHMITTRKHLP